MRIHTSEKSTRCTRYYKLRIFPITNPNTLLPLLPLVIGKKHEPVKVRRAHLISVLLFVKGKKNTPKQLVVLWVNRRKNPQDVISDPQYEGMSVPHNIATFW